MLQDHSLSPSEGCSYYLYSPFQTPTSEEPVFTAVVTTRCRLHPLLHLLPPPREFTGGWGRSTTVMHDF